MTQETLSPSEVVRQYVTRTWNQEDKTAVTEFLADPCWRHDTGHPEAPFKSFSNAEQMARADDGYATGKFDFQILQLLEAGEFVTMIWDLNYTPANDAIKNGLAEKGAMFSDNGDVMMKGIEVFRVVDSKIVEIWVAQTFEFKGHWGASMS